MRRSEPGHFAFYAAIALKALYGVAETIAGAGLVFVSTDAVVAFFNGLVAPELVEDPNDQIASLIVNWANNLGHDTQIYAGIYLLLHGIAKIIVVTFLMLGRRWAYPEPLPCFLPLLPMRAIGFP